MILNYAVLYYLYVLKQETLSSLICTGWFQKHISRVIELKYIRYTKPSVVNQDTSKQVFASSCKR